MSIRNAVKPVLLTFALCAAIGSAVGFDRLAGAVVNPMGGMAAPQVRQNEPAAGNSAQQPAVATPGTEPGCIVRNFECTKGALASCYKRWRNTRLSCTDNACGSGNCIKSEIFFATYKLEQWDTGALPGPFPRSEAMCIIQSSACPPNDPLCLGPVSLEQISCDDAKCGTGTCTRLSVLVDQTDTIVSGLPSPSPSAREPKDPMDEQKSENTEGGVRVEEEQNGTVRPPILEMNNEIKKEESVLVERKSLGCFTETGGWTIDRTQCAVDQKQYVEPSRPVVPNEPENTEEQKIVERKIESQFIPDTRKSALVQSILSSTVEATSRLSRILENPGLPQDVRVALEQKQGALRQAQQSAAESEKSVRDLQQLADDVGQNLDDVQKTVTTWMESTPENFPVTVTDKLDRLFAALPTVFNVLLQSGIFVDSTTMDGYIKAQQLYDPIRLECMSDANTCGNLNTVIDALEPVFANIRLSLEHANRIDVEAQVDLLLQ